VTATRPTFVNGPATPVDKARAKYGKPFVHERESQHIHTPGPTYWNPERVAQLAADNERRRNSR
jgi:hypothetical protein